MYDKVIKCLQLMLLMFPLWAQSNIKINGYYDKVIDNNILNLTIKSENIHPIDNEDKNGFLLIRSDGGELSLKINWGGIYLGFGNRDVTYRIGQDLTITENWETTNKHMVTIAKHPVDLIKIMQESTTVIFRTTPYQESPISYEFDLSDLKNVIEKYPNHFRSIRPSSISEIIGNLMTLTLLTFTLISIIGGF
tara:strand:- start:5847 stop:6425 length:579 start_codon:yes stop_codon:yes gene_type:complete